MTKDEKSALLNLMASGKIEATLNQLKKIKVPDNQEGILIQISAQYHQFKNDEIKGILSQEQKGIARNRIGASLVAFINQLDVHVSQNRIIEENNKETAPIKTKKSLGYKIGIVGSLASIIGLLLYFLPPMGGGEVHQLTVFVTDYQGNVVLEHEGEVNTSIGNRSLRETIGENGRTNFGDIPSTYLGDNITIGFKANGWELIEPNNTFKFDGNPIYLKIRKDESLGIIKGIVKTRDGQNYIEGAKILINADTAIFTDTNGIFNVVLPEKMRVNNHSEHYQIEISKAGFVKRPHRYVLKTNPDIRLEPK